MKYKKLQAKNILNPSNDDIANMHKGKFYQRNFHNIAGFFIIEHTVSQVCYCCCTLTLKTSDRLMPEGVTEKLWTTAISKMRAVIQVNMTKNFISYFC